MREPVLAPIESPLLAQSCGPSIRHGFFTRKGGVSSGLYSSLNVGLGSNDRREDVLENRRRVAAYFLQPPERLATVHQVHSSDVVTLDGSYAGERPNADALVTRQAGLVLGVLAADCGPILFADPKNKVIGAAHAGWKGALFGIADNTIAAMIALGAEREHIHACLGPSISGRSYEVGPEFVERFLAEDPAYRAFFTPSSRERHALFDLPGLTTMRLKAAGICAENLDIDTYPDGDRFFSYRRTTHLGEADYGRQISAIAIMEA
ncbi:peptidoglycan editing factor PgeF [Rhizobium sp. SSA_523]|uniref:peptidoglycan editing factor PgeF n=1 Tax=Rhizobium sp. SSA_523 TaxID=2952477 RepID=UPI0020917CBE|nr:peptidoglycan editing factor PgeF [Rhizobium sp. SSA_523]MCO5730404.1 peptidoglycan editing factor PgeF [Rhizobium sp. SSA_523]WKC25448.1 peptidoglycan editing factor PgeF [Rhizobium sp. SSA_523]